MSTMIATLKLTTKELNTLSRHTSLLRCNNRACFVMLTKKSDTTHRYKLGSGLDKVFGINNDLTSNLLKSIYCCKMDMIRDYAFSKAIKDLAETSDKSVGIVTYFNAWKILPNGRRKMIRVVRESYVLDIVEADGSITQAYICFYADITDTLSYQPLTSKAVDTDTQEDLEVMTSKAIRKSSWKVLEHLDLCDDQEEEFLYLCAHSRKESMYKFNKTPDGVKGMTKKYREIISTNFVEGYTFDKMKAYLDLCQIF